MNRKMMVMNKGDSMRTEFDRKSKDRHEYC